MPPPRETRRPSQAIYDTYRPSDHGSHVPRNRHVAATQDRDLQDWLAYTGWNDEDYRRRFLDRQRRLADIDRERAALLEADQREVATRRDGGTDASRPPPFSEPHRAGGPRELFGPSPSGFKREYPTEHPNDYDNAHPRKFARMDAAVRSHRVSYRSPSPGGHKPRAKQYWRDEMRGDGPSPNEQIGKPASGIAMRGRISC